MVRSSTSKRSGPTGDEAHRPAAPPGEENVNQRTLRSLVCSAARQELFQVILTPHHDRAHRNHVHLELRPGVDWDYIR
jgi:hypothetical protein